MEPKTPKIADGKTYWHCAGCEQWHVASLFYVDRRTPNGLKAQCKKCHIACSIKTRDKENHRKIRRENAAKQVAANPEKYRAIWRERPRRKGPKVDARQIVHLALRIGAINRPEICEKCQQRKKLTAHHTNYKKPLQVQWLCHLCHAAEHRKQ